MAKIETTLTNFLNGEKDYCLYENYGSKGKMFSLEEWQN